MRLVSLELTNYRRFRHARVDLPDGIIGVVGRNGAGKSTLLESILWTLFGHDAARTGKELIRHQGAAPADDVAARLDFELDGTVFTLTRRLRGKALQPEVLIQSAGRLLVAPGANSWEEGNAFIEHLLGFDRASFESTVVAKQGELAALSELRPAARKRLLLEMLGVERVESAIQTCRQDGRVVAARLDEARRGLDQEPRVRTDLAAAREEAGQAERRRQETDHQLDASNTRAIATRTAAERLLESKMSDQELRLRLQALQHRLEALWNERSRLGADVLLLREREHDAKKLGVRLAGFANLDDQTRRVQDAHVRSARRAETESALAAVEMDLAQWRPRTDPRATNGSSPEHLAADVSRIRAALDAHRQEAGQTRAKLFWAQQELQRLAAPTHEHDEVLRRLGPDDPCPQCGRPLAELAERLARSRDVEAKRREEQRILLVGDVEGGARDARRIEAACAEVDQTLRRTEDALAEVQRRIREAATASEHVQVLEARRAALASSLADLSGCDVTEDEARQIDERRAARDEARQALARVEEALLRIPRLQDEQRVLQGQEAAIVGERESCTRELQRLGYVAGAWERAQAEAQTATRAVEALERDRIQWTERAEARGRDVVRLASTLKDLETRRAEADRLAGDGLVLETLAGPRGDQGLLPEFKSHLVGRIRPALARTSSALVRDMTRGRYTDLVIDDEYGVRLFDGGVAHPLERFSGGEVDIANLALRLAVSELVTNARGRSRLQFVALDEIFGSQDEDRRRAMLESLAALRHVFRQVFVVTHLDDVRDRLGHVLRVEDDGTGGASVVVEDQPNL